MALASICRVAMPAGRNFIACGSIERVLLLSTCMWQNWSIASGNSASLRSLSAKWPRVQGWLHGPSPQPPKKLPVTQYSETMSSSRPCTMHASGRSVSVASLRISLAVSSGESVAPATP